jgi:integrase
MAKSLSAGVIAPRLGLRAGDVAQLRLDHIEWETGSLRVSGKSRYEVRLPLPQDVGDAIAAYLACRPSTCPSDHVFLRNIALFRKRRLSPIGFRGFMRTGGSEILLTVGCDGGRIRRWTGTGGATRRMARDSSGGLNSAAHVRANGYGQRS